MSRPVDKKYRIGFGYHKEYPKVLQQSLGIKYHKGVDYFCPIGAKIINPVYGNLIEIGEKKYMGKYMVIKFTVLQGLAKSTYRFIAMHLSRLQFSKVMPTTTIAKGELLALSGDSGTFYDGRFHPHCHCQIDKWIKDKQVWNDVDPSFIFGAT